MRHRRLFAITSEASNKVLTVKILFDFHLCFGKAVQRTGRLGSYLTKVESIIFALATLVARGID